MSMFATPIAGLGALAAKRSMEKFGLRPLSAEELAPYADQYRGPTNFFPAKQVKSRPGIRPTRGTEDE